MSSPGKELLSSKNSNTTGILEEREFGGWYLKVLNKKMNCLYSSPGNLQCFSVGKGSSNGAFH